MSAGDERKLRTTQRAILCAAMISVAGGCADWIPEETPPNLSLRCPDGDSNPAVSISFRRDIVEAIIESQQPNSPNCSCHLPTSPNPIGVQLAGLTLSSYGSLRAGGNNTARNIVVPGHPCSSALFLKLTQTPPFGARMPFNGRFLSDEQQMIIHDWIAEGALDN
jgi:hypothetical protein